LLLRRRAPHPRAHPHARAGGGVAEHAPALLPARALTPLSTPPDASSAGSAPGSPPEAGLSRVRTVPVSSRPNKVLAEHFAAPPPAGPAQRTSPAFLASLPRILQADAFLRVVASIPSAVADRRTVLWMLGGHVVKTGLGPLLVDLMRRGAATHLASNGSAGIHDYEMARWGGTSEDVEAGLADGSFGMAEETGR